MEAIMRCSIGYFLVFVCCVAAELPTTSEVFDHTVVMDPEENVILHWNYDNKTITFEVHCRTLGWCGVGLSANGNMIRADIMLGWVKEGRGFITDRHGQDRNTYPLLDESQDVELLWADEVDGWTKLKFRRDLESCDVADDRDVTGDTTKMIFAYGDSDPEGDDVTKANYHGSERRGARSVILLGSEEKEAGRIPEGETQHTFDINVRDFTVPVIPGKETTYYNCHMFEFPQYATKRHMVKVEAIVTPGNELNVHHMLLYQCTGNLTDSEAIGQDGECFSNNMPSDFNHCGFAFQAWAIGGGPLYFPSHVGYPLGVADAPTHVLLEIHYDNPQRKTDIVDSSGLRFTVTEQLRKYDASLVSVGQAVDPFTHLIPPGADSFLNVGDCHHECLDHFMDAEGTDSFNVFGVVLHSHLLGRSLTVKHIRDGEELPHVVRDDAYDFNYQQARFLPEERQVKRGDDLQMVCSYDSSGRSEITLGGLSTEREMCIGFLWYYPKLAVTYCESTPNFQSVMNYFGINSVEYTFDAGDAHITSLFDFTLDNLLVLDPPELANRTVGDIANSIPWDEESADEFATALNAMDRRTQCRSPHETPPIGPDGDGRLAPIEILRPYVVPVKDCEKPDEVGGHVTLARLIRSTAAAMLGFPLPTYCWG